MKLYRLLFFVFLLQLVSFAHENSAFLDSTSSFIKTERILANDQKTGKIKEAFWNVELKTMDGKILKMKSLKGKFVYLNFWGEWCPGCREEMPFIVDAYKKFKDKAEFIGLLKPHDINKAVKFISERRMNFPQVILQKKLKNKFNFDGFPLSFLIFPDGKTYLRVDEVDKNFFILNIK